MIECEEKLKAYVKEKGISAEHLHFSEPCHSVEEAAKAAKASPEDFVKNICMLDQEGNLIVAIVKGENRASTSRVAKALNLPQVGIATPDEVLKKTGYPAGGIPSFGYPAKFLIDEKVMEKDIVYSGGGSENSLVRISAKEILRANSGSIIRVRK